MDTYLIMLYVSLEQEKALKNFFIQNGWRFCKPDLLKLTDKLGPVHHQSIQTGPDFPDRNKTTEHGRAGKQTPQTKVVTRSSGKSLVASKNNKDTRARNDMCISTGNEVDESAMIVKQEPNTADGYASMDDGDDDDDFEQDPSFLEETLMNKSQQWKQHITVKIPATKDNVEKEAVGKSSFGTNSYQKVDGTTIEEMDQNLGADKTVHQAIGSGNDWANGIANEVIQNNDQFLLNQRVQSSVKAQSSRVLRKRHNKVLVSGINTEMEGEKGTENGLNAEGNDETIANFKPKIEFAPDIYDGTNTVQKHRCELCEQLFPSNKGLAVHKKVKHNCQVMELQNEKQHICEICGKVFRRVDILRDHVRGIHFGIKRKRNPPKKQTERKFTCNLCQKAFFRKSNLTEHVTLKHVAEPVLSHSCQHCDKTFHRPSKLEYHTNKVHLNEKPYICDKCGKGLYSKVSLHYHKELCMMAEDKMLHCDHCGKKCTTRQNLEMHVQAIHADPVVCQCGAVVKWKSSLAKHKRRCSLNAHLADVKPDHDYSAEVTIGGQSTDATAISSSIDSEISSSMLQQVQEQLEFLADSSVNLEEVANLPSHSSMGDQDVYYVILKD